MFYFCLGAKKRHVIDVEFSQFFDQKKERKIKKKYITAIGSMQQYCCYLMMEYRQMKNLLLLLLVDHDVRLLYHHVQCLLAPKIESLNI